MPLLCDKGIYKEEASNERCDIFIKNHAFTLIFEQSCVVYNIPLLCDRSVTKKRDELASLCLRKSAYRMLRFMNEADAPVFRINENIWQVYLIKKFLDI